MDDLPRCGPLLVAVGLDRQESLLRCAVDVARRLDAELVVVHVEESVAPAYSVVDGSMIMLPLDPDLPDDTAAEATRSVRDWVEQHLAASGVRWRWEAPCGEPAGCLTDLAEEIGAAVIVLGAPRHGPMRALTRLLDGSVAAKVTRQPDRPVLLVP